MPPRRRATLTAFALTVGAGPLAVLTAVSAYAAPPTHPGTCTTTRGLTTCTQTTYGQPEIVEGSNYFDFPCFYRYEHIPYTTTTTTYHGEKQVGQTTSTGYGPEYAQSYYCI